MALIKCNYKGCDRLISDKAEKCPYCGSAVNIRELDLLFKKYNSIVLFDVETTGTNVNSDDIVEFAAVKVKQNMDGRIYINSSADIPIRLLDGKRFLDNIMQITRITEEFLLAKGVIHRTAREKIVKILEDCNTLLVAHNVGFDYKFLIKLLDSEENFIGNNKFDVLAALIHYQFEAIHLFLDGNGRVGRLMITLFLIENKVLTAPSLYISYFLKKIVSSIMTA